MTTEPADFTREQRLVGMQATLRILTVVWHLNDEMVAEVIGSTVAAVQGWRDGPSSEPVTDEQFARASYVLGIHKALDTLVPKRSAHPGFLRREAPALDGESPLDVMRQGPDGLRRVRRWLDGECQW